MLPGFGAASRSRFDGKAGIAEPETAPEPCIRSYTAGLRKARNLGMLEMPETAGGDINTAVAAAVRRARDGDPDAFRALFQRYARPIMAFLYNMLGERSRVEELTQETFCRAYRGLGNLRDGTRISTWLFGIARNVAHEAMRERGRNLRLVGLEDGDAGVIRDVRAGPDDRYLAAELRQVLCRSLERLSEDRRAVFVLKMLHNLPYQEIAEITGSSIGKLKTDLHRARQQLREILLPYMAGQGEGGGS